MRRGNGEGSIFKLGGKRRKPWAVRITVGFTPEGKQITKYLSYHVSKSEAKTALREYLVDPYDIELNKISFGQVFEDWQKNADLSERTMEAYINMIKRLSHLHKEPMNKLKVGHFEDYMNQLTPGNARMMKNALNQLYTYAMKHEVVDKNIVALITVKKADSEKEVVPFTLEQINQIKNYRHSFTDTALILLYTGLRINELLEIENRNVHLDKRYMIGGKKTRAGISRIIPIHDEIYDLIKKRYDPENKYLICFEDKKLIRYQRYRQRFWNMMAEQFGFEQTPHATRHTFVTFADRQGLNRITVQKIIGHKNAEITDHYTHRSIEELIEEINKLKYE